MKQPQFVVVCDNIRSTHNIGSIFRTADGAGVGALYLCGITPVPPRRDIEKVSLGAEHFVPFYYRVHTVRLVRLLRRQGYHILALETPQPQSCLYTEVRLRRPIALIIGGEAAGVSREILKLAHAIVHIPMYGLKESLNVSVAFGVVAYSIAERFHHRKKSETKP